MTDQRTYTRSLATAGFNGAVFTCANFQKIAHISGLCSFHKVSEGIPSIMPFWLLMPSVLQIWLLQIFTRPKKTYEPRIGYWVLSKRLSQRSCTIIGFQIMVGCLFSFQMRPLEILEIDDEFMGWIIMHHS